LGGVNILNAQIYIKKPLKTLKKTEINTLTWEWGRGIVSQLGWYLRPLGGGVNITDEHWKQILNRQTFRALST